MLMFEGPVHTFTSSENEETAESSFQDKKEVKGKKDAYVSGSGLQDDELGFLLQSCFLLNCRKTNTKPINLLKQYVGVQKQTPVSRRVEWRLGRLHV